VKKFLLGTLATLVLAAADFGLLVWIGSHVGAWPAIAFAAASAVIGIVAGKKLGSKMIASWTESVRQQRMPEEGALAGGLILYGSMLLVLPGPVTSVMPPSVAPSASGCSRSSTSRVRRPSSARRASSTTR
jgi:UPF0716 protein FxsA